MKCMRCPEPDEYERKEMLSITLEDDGIGEQKIWLCPRCSIFILATLGAAPSLIAVPNPHKKGDVVIDIIEMTVPMVQLVAKKLADADPCMMSGGHMEGVDHDGDPCPVGVAS